MIRSDNLEKEETKLKKQIYNQRKLLEKEQIDRQNEQDKITKLKTQLQKIQTLNKEEKDKQDYFEYRLDKLSSNAKEFN